MSDELKDTLTESGEKPDMGALHQEYDNAWANDLYEDGRLNYVERVRYARWPGQNMDGLQHREDYEAVGREVLWPGAADTRILLADDIINYLVAMFVMAFWNAKVKTSPVTGKMMNAAQAGELWTVLNWLKNGPLKTQLIENVEIAAQLTATVGWCVLHPTWRNRKIMVQQKVTMDDVQNIAAKVKQSNPQGRLSMLALLPEIVMDSSMEDTAVELFQQFFPEISKADARKHIKELRDAGETEFPQVRDSSIGPELGVLCPWYHFILPIEATARPADARLKFVRVLIPKWRVDEWAEAEEWDDPLFVEKLKNAAGDFQEPPRTKESDRDWNRNLCELVYAFRTVVKDGATSTWCTVMSPRVTADQQSGKGGYGRNWELNMITDRLFIFCRLESTDWCVTDTRGVPDVVATYQTEMKNFRDATFNYTQLNVTPPIQRVGTAASKLPPTFGPFAMINSPGGKPYERLDLTSGTNIEVPFKLQEQVRKEAEDYYGLPRGDTPPARSQLKQQKLVNQWLAQMGEALDQLAVLAYQNMDPEELQGIIGHAPLLDAETVAKHKVVMSYDVRTGDGDFINRLKETMTAILGAGLGNDLLLNKVVAWWLSYVDPNAAAEFLPDEQAGGRQAQKDARDELNNVMIGNKPMLVQMDPAAKTKMGYVQQLVQGNPAYQRKLSPQINGQPNPDHDPVVAENFETMMKNWQHSYQETVLSKAQGRTGVKQVS